ncbi:MAG TPA: pyridoxal-dependent decarboxylase [Pyrinomonadaceae bacterium]|nr:pyridoxal-dependent decarboxylase [Pyrinomonadaceae bacterium]
MDVPRDSESLSFEKTAQGLKRLMSRGEVPEISGQGTRALEAWFLGTKGENVDVLERLVVEAIRDQAFWRRNYHPSDPTHITEEMRRSPEYLQAMDSLQQGFRDLLSFLKKSVPFFSMRYQGHMNWDLTLPGILGYFSAMLYNPNNVAFEGSTATTLLEILVGDDLCRMLGFNIPTHEDADAIRPWGHVTCDGTVANIEAIWSSRNLKLFAVALQAALNNEDSLKKARDITIALPQGGNKPLVSLDLWALLNLRADDVLALTGRLSTEFDLERKTITAALDNYSLQNLGIQEFSRRYLKELKHAPVFMVPGTKHYSFPKAAAVLGIGAANMIDVPVDKDARLSIDALRQKLQECLAEQRPVLTVVAVMGTTEESAIDPVREVLELREEFRAQGMDFTVHADGAWGGYHASVVRADFDMPSPNLLFAPPPAPRLSKYVTDQYNSLGEVDSITVDPHKSGYIPYPAGALCYRNSAMRDLVTFSAPVVFHGDAEPTIGIYGIEGSKPGAAAAAVYLSHRVIRPSKSGYGKIIGQALYSCKRLYTRLLCMAGPSDVFTVHPVARLSAVSEVPGKTLEDKIAYLREHIDQKTNDEISSDKVASALLSELGPDLNILAYAFNFKTVAADGTSVVNTDLKLANKLNKAIYNRLSITPGDDIYKYDLIVSTTDLTLNTYGADFFNDYAERMGITVLNDDQFTVLRSVVMDPWVTETTRLSATGKLETVSFIDTLEKEFRKAVTGALKEIGRSD